MEHITSLQNPKIKNIVKLSKNRERKEQGLFIIEGARELSLALMADYEADSVFICPELFVKSDYPDVLDSISQDKLFEVTEAVFDKIAYREGSDGLLTLAKPKSHTLSDLELSDNPFIIILEAVEKPGNLGAILRTADAAQTDAVIICDPATDLYNPNAIRSSVGCLFTVQTAVCSSQEALDFLHKNNIRSFAAELQASLWYQDTDFTVPSAIVMGTEADGLTDFWLNNADARIKIPMRGKIDSLNVSVSTAVITFEAMRQRGF
ncbi:TrmH family RNA methyltransferase [Dysgonomonas sp. PFB1-18]|uniref:TrmH family RNA methyltransferase n=1 Tax=unclassified Dysgonomonas TaxID=2630389 RepID=UPI0024758DB0|nr:MULTISPECIES: TrmH family RNA methyltransferase [unclassified Dysgonomonas]MDH6307224.1 TrmH family RNA methyltransferase [Dysgonomonas sp. PF1-14]MDH6337142.1 TrmH family RNA methyltransferase [Dysgonomonas sp. PF1-16]MDH6381128.1 TrmH family RNA methyltransferase [Dysgonomonas sp. PFB1-18]MDH6396292.1 TrmH family RNA methyltransferase [Dysgonomonas sp. PF1-23]